jgi:hypothetical protein
MIIHFIINTYLFISLTEMGILYHLSARDPSKFSKRWKLTLYQNHLSDNLTDSPSILSPVDVVYDFHPHSSR